MLFVSFSFSFTFSFTDACGWFGHCLGKTILLFFKECFHFGLGDLTVFPGDLCELRFALFLLLLGWASSLVLANPSGSCFDFTPLDETIFVGIEMAEQPVNLIIDIVSSNLNGLSDS